VPPQQAQRRAAGQGELVAGAAGQVRRVGQPDLDQPAALRRDGGEVHRAPVGEVDRRRNRRGPVHHENVPGPEQVGQLVERVMADLVQFPETAAHQQPYVVAAQAARLGRPAGLEIGG
jgi:hypothetical protein